MKFNEINIDEASSNLNYCPLTGILKWRNYPNKKCGTAHREGYINIMLNGKQYAAHRLAWALHFGRNPDGEIDHVNMIKDDNRIENLRDVTRSLNQQNRTKCRKDNSCGLLGVCLVKKSGKFSAEIRFNGNRLKLGHHDTPQQAHQAYLEAKRRLHSTCTI